MQHVPEGEILETKRAYYIWRWMSAIVSHFKWCHRWLITDQDTNQSPHNNACYPVICISCAQSEHSWLIMLDKGHCWSANNISAWTDLSILTYYQQLRDRQHRTVLFCIKPIEEGLCVYVSIDRVLQSKANGQIYEWNSPIYKFYEWNYVTFYLKFRDQILIIMYLGWRPATKRLINNAALKGLILIICNRI